MPTCPNQEQRLQFPVIRHKVMVRLEGESEYQSLSWYYKDEISFTPEELVGKAVKEARQLHHEEDMAYLQS